MESRESFMTLVLATANQGKVEELREMVKPFHLEVKSLADYPEIPEVEEDGTTFYENALKKAKTIADLLHLPVLADDSGLEVDALQGEPGVYSARYAGEHGNHTANNLKLLQALQNIQWEQRTARFRSVLILILPGEEPIVAEGKCEGWITNEIHGSGGFGYDPLFYVKEYGKTLAEVTMEEKNRISHRGKAMRAMLQHIERLKR